MVKKKLLVYIVATLVFFAFIILFRRWFDILYWPFVVGGLVGALLPDIDHFIYAYFLHPGELTSQRINYSLNNKHLLSTLEVVYHTEAERRKLIFHTALFHVFFLIFSFLVVSSSSSLFGKGLVLAFLLHLSIDEWVDLQKIGNIKHWFHNIAFKLDHNEEMFFWLGGFLLLLVNGFLL